MLLSAHPWLPSWNLRPSKRTHQPNTPLPILQLSELSLHACALVPLGPFYIVWPSWDVRHPFPPRLSCYLREVIGIQPTLGSTPHCYSVSPHQPIVSGPLASAIPGIYSILQSQNLICRLLKQSPARLETARGACPWGWGRSCSGRKLCLRSTCAERCVKMEVAGVEGCEATVSRGRPREVKILLYPVVLHLPSLRTIVILPALSALLKHTSLPSAPRYFCPDNFQRVFISRSPENFPRAHICPLVP